ncbi:hypothetical protein PSN01_03877 [Micromonospora saelicesensis]|nr:hypothetical protein PSN01_03877 [Micromonospora saelicesensis]
MQRAGQRVGAGLVEPTGGAGRGSCLGALAPAQRGQPVGQGLARGQHRLATDLAVRLRLRLGRREDGDGALLHRHHCVRVGDRVHSRRRAAQGAGEQLAQHGPGGVHVESARRVLLEQTHQHPGQRAAALRWGGWVLHHGVHGLDRVALVERGPPLDRGVERHTQREEVTGRAELLAHGPLGRDEVRRAEHHAGGGELHVGGHPGDPEVGQHAAPVGADQHVCGLDVAVQHADRVRDLQRAEQRDADLGDGTGRDRPVLDHHVGEAAGVQQLHHDPRPAGLGDHVVHLHHSGVLDGGGGAGLPQGAFVHRVAVAGGQPRGQDDLLHRHVTAQQGVCGAPHRAHAAVAHRGPQRVPATNGGAGRRSSVGGTNWSAAPRRDLSHRKATGGNRGGLGHNPPILLVPTPDAKADATDVCRSRQNVPCRSPGVDRSGRTVRYPSPDDVARRPTIRG